MREAAIHRRALGIEGATDAEDIRLRYRAMMRRWHPDRAPRGNEDIYLERAKELNAAREWLLAHPTSWRAETPMVPATHPQARRAEDRSAPVPPMSAPVAASHPRSGMSWVGVVVAVYFGLLAFSIVGWLLTGMLPAVLSILG